METNAIDTKQNKSTTLSFGTPNGEWSSVTHDDYIDLQTEANDTTKLRINTNMIANDLEDTTSDGALVTAHAVRQVLNGTTSSSDNDTVSVPMHLEYFTSRYDGLVTLYNYTTRATRAEILEYVRDNICNGTISEKWCYYSPYDGSMGGGVWSFYVIKRNVGYYLRDYDFDFNNGEYFYYTSKVYALNIPDNVNPVSYATEHFCAGKSFCYVTGVSSLFDLDTFNQNMSMYPLYEVNVFSQVDQLTELPRSYSGN